MKHFHHLVVIFCHLLVLASVAAAQEKIEISTDPPPADARFPVLREVGTAKVLRFERNDQVISEAPFIRFRGIGEESLGVKARFTSAGKTVLKPSEIQLVIYPFGTDRKYVDDRTIKIVADGKEILNSKTKFQRANTDGTHIMAELLQLIPYDDFVKISQAKQVRIQIGPSMVELKEADIAGFRDLLKTVE